MADKLTIEVSIKDIYDSVQELKKTTADILGHVKKTNGRVNKCEDKIVKMEKIDIKRTGIITGVVSAVTLIANYIF